MYVDKNIYSSLEDRLLDLIDRFIDCHKDPTESPESYALDVESFILLSHAAFEEFVEELGKAVANESLCNFKSGKISKTTLCLLHFSDSDSLSNWDESKTLYDRLLTKYFERVNQYNNSIADNNGVNLKYLKKILIPIGLDIPHEFKHTNAISTLATMRGGFAHKYKQAVNNVKTPQYVLTIMYDVLEYMELLMKQAQRICYFESNL
jgi:hypothetical protein